MTAAPLSPIKVTQDGMTTYLPDGSVFGTAGKTNTTDFTSAGGSITAGGNDTVYAGAKATTVTIGTDAYVVGEAGALTVTGGSGNSTILGGTGGLVYTGGAGMDLVAGDGHTAVITGGTGGGEYFGGGNATITAGAGGQSIVIGGNGDHLNAVGSGTVLFGVSGGDVNFSSLGSTGLSDVFGQGCQGTMTFIAGTGTDLIGLGQGINTITLGSGTEVVFGNTGTTATSNITTGSGSEEIPFGGKTMDLAIAAVSQSRNLFLFDFVPGADHLHLQGVSAAQTSAALAAQTPIGPGATMNLPDGTVLWFMNNTQIGSSFFS